MDRVTVPVELFVSSWTSSSVPGSGSLLLPEESSQPDTARAHPSRSRTSHARAIICPIVFISVSSIRSADHPGHRRPNDPALYNQPQSPDKSRRNFRNSRNSKPARPSAPVRDAQGVHYASVGERPWHHIDPPEYKVEARREEALEPPVPIAILPYRRALLPQVYAVESAPDASGLKAGDRIAVAHRALLDGTSVQGEPVENISSCAVVKGVAQRP